jgi:hypothetical protein
VLGDATLAEPAPDVDGELGLELDPLVGEAQLGGSAMEGHRLAPAERAEHGLQGRRTFARTTMGRWFVSDERAVFTEVEIGHGTAMVHRGDDLAPDDRLGHVESALHLGHHVHQLLQALPASSVEKISATRDGRLIAGSASLIIAALQNDGGWVRRPWS